jgi:hypothetical protein
MVGNNKQETTARGRNFAEILTFIAGLHESSFMPELSILWFSAGRI